MEAAMDFHSPVSFEHFDPSVVSSEPGEFHSEEYLEYRRRVFEELASEYDNQESRQYHSQLMTETSGDYDLIDIHYPMSPTQEHDYLNGVHDDDSSNSAEEMSRDLSPSQQPAWDDTDLQPGTVVTSPLLKTKSETSMSDFRTNLLNLSEELSYGDEISPFMGGNETEEVVQNEDTMIPSMHWTELEKQLELMTKHHKDQVKQKKQTSLPHTPFSPPLGRRSTRSHLQKQKNDRQAILQKLSGADPDIDSIPYGPPKPWHNPRSNQNLQICYINDSCSSSDNEESTTNSKTSPSSGANTSPTSSPVLSSPGFGMRRSLPLYRMSSSSSTVSLSSTSSGGHYASSSSTPGDGEIINIRSSINTGMDEVPKVRTRQEQLELQARIAITQAHQEARKLAEEERKRSRKESTSSYEKLLLVPLDDATKLKVKNKSLSKDDCKRMTVGQLQVILNNMHMEKESLNSELKTILEVRDELRTEQDGKLTHVEDMKAMLAVTGPETTV